MEVINGTNVLKMNSGQVVLLLWTGNSELKANLPGCENPKVNVKFLIFENVINFLKYKVFKTFINSHPKMAFQFLFANNSI